jgi:hypothetical protein
VALVAHLVALLLLAPLSAWWIAPLGVLVPGRGPRAAVVSLLLDLPILVLVAPAAWLAGRLVEARPGRLAVGHCAALYALDALTSFFVTANLDRWMDLWSAGARLAGAAFSIWLARRITRQAGGAVPS